MNYVLSEKRLIKLARRGIVIRGCVELETKPDNEYTRLEMVVITNDGKVGLFCFSNRKSKSGDISPVEFSIVDGLSVKEILNRWKNHFSEWTKSDQAVYMFSFDGNDTSKQMGHLCPFWFTMFGCTKALAYEHILKLGSIIVPQSLITMSLRLDGYLKSAYERVNKVVLDMQK